MATRQHRNGVFLSYRRADGAAYAGRLYDSLHARLGRRVDLFMDVEKLTPGVDFVEALDAAIARCRVVLVVIDPTWTSVRSGDGTRRLDDDQDWVRREVAHSLVRPDLRVIPVLVGGATMPTEAKLPDDLRALARREAFEVTASSWSRDVDALAEQLGGKSSRARRPALFAAAALAVVAVIGIVIAIRHNHSDTVTVGGSTTTTTAHGNQPPAASTTVPGPVDAINTVLWQDSMTDPATPWRVGAGGSQCKQAITSSGYKIATEVANLSCGDTANFHKELTNLTDTAVQVKGRLDSAKGPQPSLIIECHTSGGTDNFSGYEAALGDRDLQFVRYDAGRYSVYAESNIGGTLVPGEVHRLRLDCYASGSKFVVALREDGAFVGGIVDPTPLPAGSVGAECGTGDNTTASCTFSDFEVLAPAGAPPVPSVSELGPDKTIP